MLPRWAFDRDYHGEPIEITAKRAQCRRRTCNKQIISSALPMFCLSIDYYPHRFSTKLAWREIVPSTNPSFNSSSKSFQTSSRLSNFFYDSHITRALTSVHIHMLRSITPLVSCHCTLYSNMLACFQYNHLWKRFANVWHFITFPHPLEKPSALGL